MHCWGSTANAACRLQDTGSLAGPRRHSIHASRNRHPVNPMDALAMIVCGPAPPPHLAPGLCGRWQVKKVSLSFVAGLSLSQVWWNGHFAVAPAALARQKHHVRQRHLLGMSEAWAPPAPPAISTPRLPNSPSLEQLHAAGCRSTLHARHQLRARAHSSDRPQGL